MRLNKYHCHIDLLFFLQTACKYIECIIRLYYFNMCIEGLPIYDLQIDEMSIFIRTAIEKIQFNILFISLLHRKKEWQS